MASSDHLTVSTVTSNKIFFRDWAEISDLNRDVVISLLFLPIR